MKPFIVLNLLLIPFVSSLHAVVNLEVSYHSSDLWEATIKEDIAAQIEEGLLDNAKVKMPFLSIRETDDFSNSVQETPSGKTYLKINSKTFTNFPDEIQEQIVENMSEYYNRISYRVWVDQERNQLAKQDIVKRLKTDLKKLPSVTPAERLLSGFAQTWAYKYATKSGPNCWHSSMASIFPKWRIARYMGPREFACHLKKSFVKLSQPTQLGDLIRLKYKGGSSDVHGFTYVGVDRNYPSRKIVFTKNGYSRSYYIYMTLADVKKMYSSLAGGAPVLEYYRPKYNVVDPKEGGPNPCSNSGGSTSERPSKAMASPILLYGLKAQPPEGFDPIVY